MAREFFSFGDEDLGPDRDEEETAPFSGGPVATMSEPEHPAPALDWEGDWAAEEAQRSRGDSEQSSSENREPPSLRAYGAVVLGLVVGVLLVGHLVRDALGGNGSGSPVSHKVHRHADGAVAVAAPQVGTKQDRPRAQVRRRSSPSGHRDRRRRSQTRRHARRRRAQRTTDRRRQHSGVRQQGAAESSTSSSPSAAPVESAPPPTSSSTSSPSEPPATSEPPASAEAPTSSPPADSPSSSPPSATEAAQAQFGIEGQ